MRLTVDVLLRGEASLNTIQDRELNLRGYKIPAIENLAVLQDQFDTIDFSDNEIKKLENFPRMDRLGTLILCNNYISRIAKNIGENLVKLHSLNLSNNRLCNMSEIENLSALKKLEHLSLLENPIVHHPTYRVYVISKIPTLKSLDFRKVTAAEREEAKKWSRSEDGRAISAHVSEEHHRLQREDNEAERQQGSGSTGGLKSVMSTLSENQRAQVRAAIEAASSKNDIDRIEFQLRNGTFEFK